MSLSVCLFPFILLTLCLSLSLSVSLSSLSLYSVSLFPFLLLTLFLSHLKLSFSLSPPPPLSLSLYPFSPFYSFSLPAPSVLLINSSLINSSPIYYPIKFLVHIRLNFKRTNHLQSLITIFKTSYLRNRDSLISI